MHALLPAVSLSVTSTYTLISAFTPRRSLFSSRIGLITFERKLSTCSLDLPIYLDGSMDFCRSSKDNGKAGSAAISSRRLLSLPSTFTVFPASMESSRIFSCSSCLLPPSFTASIMIFYVAMKGSSLIRCFSITFG